MKLFKNLTSGFGEDFFGVSSFPCSARSPIHQSHQILLKIFEKGHPRNISVKLFQNLTSDFREDFLRISSCPYSAKFPHSPEPC